MRSTRLLAAAVVVELVVGAIGVANHDTASAPNAADATRAGQSSAARDALGRADGNRTEKQVPASTDEHAAATTTTHGSSTNAASRVGSATTSPAPTFEVEGQTGELTPEEKAELDRAQRSLDGAQSPPRNPDNQRGDGPSVIFEGRLSDGTAWRVRAGRSASGTRICVDQFHYTSRPDGTGSGGGGGGCYDPAFDVTGGTSSGSTLAFWDGPVSSRAAAMMIEAADGRVGRAWLYEAPALGVKIFVAAVDCQIALKRLFAVDSNGREMGSDTTAAGWGCMN